MKYRIVELKDRSSDGLVGHSVIARLKRLAEFVAYDEARTLVEGLLKDGDFVIEEYQSSGREVTLTAQEFKAKQVKQQGSRGAGGQG